jgi:hypothetical protein
VLARIDALLAEAGSDKDHLLNATIYLKDIGSGFAPMNDVWSRGCRRAWRRRAPPCRRNWRGRCAGGNQRDCGTQITPRPTENNNKNPLTGCTLGLLLALRSRPTRRRWTGTLSKIANAKSITLGYRDASVPFSYVGIQRQADGLFGGPGEQDRRAHPAENRCADLKVKYNLVTSKPVSRWCRTAPSTWSAAPPG